MVKCEIFQDAPALHVHNFALVMHEVVNGKIFLERIVDAVETALLQAREIQRGFAERLAGNRAGIDTTAAHMLAALDDGHAFAKIGGLRAGLLAGWTAADDDQIEIVSRSHEFLRGALTLGHVIYFPEDCRRSGSQTQKFLVGAYWMSCGSDVSSVRNRAA